MTHQEWRQSPEGVANYKRYTEGPDKDKDRVDGFDGVDRNGRIWYGRGMTMFVGPSPITGQEMTVVTNGQIVQLPKISGTYQDIVRANLPTSGASLYDKTI